MIKPKVTIIIPVYNAAKYMKEAIDSALNQTYKNIEVIVINDGSSDNTEEIAKSYGNKIIYYGKENGGVSTVLNLGISKMTGEYFSWLSHDDVYMPNKIEDQINYLEENNLAKENVILYSDYMLIDEKSKLVANCIKNTTELNEKPEYGVLRGAINGITLLIPARAFKDCGVFDETKRCTQDYELWYDMMKKYKFIHVPGMLAKSRTHRNQESNTNPRVLSEGNPMWINMGKDLDIKIKERLEGSEYGFNVEMAKFLKDTPYVDATEYFELEAKKIRESFKVDKLEKYKVSVIIPFYNRIDVTVEAIKSAQAQTHSNIEILAVNDGSTDSIKEIEFLAKADNRIKLLSVKNNNGASNARNVGLDRATGDYIAFLDSDDLFLSNKIDYQLTEMLLCKANVSHTSYQRKSEKIIDDVHSGKQNGSIIQQLIYTCQIATPTVMIEKKYLEKNKFRFNSHLTIGEDTCFWLTILRKEKLLGIDNILTTVRIGETSAAYNNDKQIVGLKTILQFVLNDEEYSKYDCSIARLANSYVGIVSSSGKGLELNQANILCPNCADMINSRSWRITKPLRLMSKVNQSIKEIGLKRTFDKVSMYFAKKK